MKNILLSLFIIQTICLFNSTSGFKIPKPFNDLILPQANEVQRNGQAIEFLGHVIKLDTLLSAKDVNYISPKFSIFNRHKKTENIPFTPNKICLKDNESQACYGPFQYDLERLSLSGFNPSLKTVIMISGFLSKDKVDWMEESKDLWLQLEDVNVILVTWSSANRGAYSKAVANSVLVSRQITIFLYYLAELNDMSLIDDEFARKIHFVGHSLGAHIAGFVGKDLNGKLGRITGLDPAGPSFDQFSRQQRLDKGDAILVDVIHTNAGKIHYINAAASGIIKAADTIMNNLPIVNYFESSLTVKNYTNEGDTAWFGIDRQVGDVDYYANSGKTQPGCQSDIIHTCDHGRSNELFVDILKYEIELMRYATTRQNLKQNRLIAFKSNDYNHFSTGENLNLFCPQILVDKDCLHNIDKNMNSCSIPIDLLTPVDELAEEFKEEYDIDIMDNGEYDVNKKYYFKTLKNRPLVSDHYLVKVHLDKETTFWNENCALNTQLTMVNGFKTEIVLNKQMNLVESGDFYGIAMPFAASNGCAARDALNNILLSPVSDKNNKLTENDYTLQLMQRVFPSFIDFEITEAHSSTMVEAIKSKLKHLLLLDKFGKSQQDNCRLSIELIEIQPLIRHDRGIVGLYKFEKFDRAVTMFRYDECNNFIKQTKKGNPFILRSSLLKGRFSIDSLVVV